MSRPDTKHILSIYTLSFLADILFALANGFSAFSILKSIFSDSEEGKKKKKRGNEELGFCHQSLSLAGGSKRWVKPYLESFAVNVTVLIIIFTSADPHLKEKTR